MIEHTLNIKNKAIYFIKGIAFLMFYTSPGLAADIWPEYSRSYTTVRIEGEIEEGDAITFEQIVKENYGTVNGVVIYSPGGNYYEAMKIGRAIRKLELNSMVPMTDERGRAECRDPDAKDPQNCTCASSCFFIHIGGVHRGGDFMGVHRPYFKKGGFGELPQVSAKSEFEKLQETAKQYMKEMGVPKQVEENLLATPSDDILMLDKQTVTTHFWGHIPYRHEWLENKCTSVTPSEKSILKEYSKKLRNDHITSEELETWTNIQKKDEADRTCSIAAVRQGLLLAYKAYFGVEAKDADYQNFGFWSRARNYLGRSFYSIQSEGGFQKKDKFGGTSFAKDSSSSNPYISLSDSIKTPKTVTRANLVSRKNPSQTYMDRLVAELDKSWGPHKADVSSGNKYWSEGEFFAELKQLEDELGRSISLELTINHGK